MKYIAYCDGASRKDRRGGWGATIRQADGRPHADICGGEHDTTNNRMEMLAVIETLWFLPANSSVVCICDSKYVVENFNEYLWLWKRNNWRTTANKPVKNEDLWRELDSVVGRHKKVEFQWVKGHTGVEGNERADYLAGLGVPEAP